MRLVAGIVSYMMINTTTWLVKLVSGGRIVLQDKEFKKRGRGGLKVGYCLLGLLGLEREEKISGMRLRCPLAWKRATTRHLDWI